MKRKEVLKLFKNKQKLIWLLCTFIVFSFFQNCAQQRFVGKKVATQHALPFDQEKVIIDEALLTAGDANQKLSVEQKISVLIDNTCAQELCDAPTEKSFTCDLWKKHHSKALEFGFQFYESQLPEPMNKDEILNWIDQTTSDRKCLIGISDLKYYEKSTFSDSLQSQQSGYLNILNFETGFNKIKPETLNKVKVGIVDTGVEDHGDMVAVTKRVDSRSDLSKSDVNCPANVKDYLGHGTAVASIIAAITNNSKGMVGLVANAEIYAYMIGRCTDGQASTAEIGNGILASLQDQVDVLNVSYGGNTGDDPSLRQALLIALNTGVPVIIAAGNSDQDITPNGDPLKNFYPAVYANSYPGLINVAAITNDYKKASFSNFSQTAVKLAAPGVGILAAASQYCQFCNTIKTDSAGNKFSAVDGTSFSAPIVTSAMALIIGYLKTNKIIYDPQYLETILIKFGTSTNGNLYTAVKDGRYLDFNALANSLVKITGSNPDTSAITTYTNIDNSGPTPVITVTVNWNLTSVHPGARLGVYDSTCAGTAAGCLIQDVPLTGTSGSYSFRFTRNDLVPMMPDKKDPNYALNLMVAVHYPIPSVYDSTGKPIAYLANHGIDASRLVNVRNIDASTDASTILGRVTNIRTDMQYTYVQGWTCYKGSNAAVTIGLQNSTGQPYSSYYSYNYGLMVIHTPAEGSPGAFDNYLSLSQRPYAKPGMASGIEVIRNSASTSFLAGLESNPQSVLACNTLTAAHGFEFVIPNWMISKNNMADLDFQVLASYKSQKSILKDDSGRANFYFPKVNFQKSVSNSISIDRSGDDYKFDGKICSTSPAPVEVEISTNYSAFLASIFGNNPRLNKAVAGQRPDLNTGDFCNGLGCAGHVYNPNFSKSYTTQVTSLTIRLKNQSVNEYSSFDAYLTAIENNDVLVDVAKADMTTYNLDSAMDSVTYANNSTYRNKYDQLSPNTINMLSEVFKKRSFDSNMKWSTEANNRTSTYDFETQARIENTERKISQAVEAAIDLQKYKQISTNLPLKYYDGNIETSIKLGPQVVADKSAYNQVRAASSIFTIGGDWDAYDMGAPFSTDLIGYSYDITNPVGKYLYETYHVKSLLRETKKFETPYSAYDVEMGYQTLDFNSNGGCGALYEHKLNAATVKERSKYIAKVAYAKAGYWVNGYNPAGKSSLPSESTIMRNLPLTLRFFQDGKMILHLESDANSNWVEVKYPYQNENY